MVFLRLIRQYVGGVFEVFIVLENEQVAIRVSHFRDDIDVRVCTISGDVSTLIVAVQSVS